MNNMPECWNTVRPLKMEIPSHHELQRKVFFDRVNFAATLPNVMPNWQNADFSVFLDAGNVWGVDYSSTVDDSNTIRSAAGIALDWYTPVGPLSFSYAGVLSKASSDKTESFRFNLGTTF